MADQPNIAARRRATAPPWIAAIRDAEGRAVHSGRQRLQSFHSRPAALQRIADLLAPVAALAYEAASHSSVSRTGSPPRAGSGGCPHQLPLVGLCRRWALVPCASASRRIAAIRILTVERTGPTALGDRLRKSATHPIDPLWSVEFLHSRLSHPFDYREGYHALTQIRVSAD